MPFISSQPYALAEGINSDGSPWQAYLQSGVYYLRNNPNTTTTVPVGYIDPSAQSVRFASSNTVTTPSGTPQTLLGGVLTDISGTPGSGTINTPRGRAAFAALASSVTITSSLVTAASTIIVVLESTDATLTLIDTVAPGAGSFVVTANGIATGNPKFSFLVVNS